MANGATFAFVCGHCKETAIAHAEHWQTTPDEDDFEHLEVCVSCNRCFKLSILYFNFFKRLPRSLNEKKKLLAELEAGAAVTSKVTRQYPTLIRPLPRGAPYTVLNEAWREAETAFSRTDMPTLATIAYRRVIESAAKHIDSENASKKTPLGVRMKNLLDEGLVSQELYDLTAQALQFGNAAAHEPKPLKQTDARVARDLPKLS